MKNQRINPLVTNKINIEKRAKEKREAEIKKNYIDNNYFRGKNLDTNKKKYSTNLSIS